MAEVTTKLPVKNEEKPVQPAGSPWAPFEALRTEIDRLFDCFTSSSWQSSLDRSLCEWINLFTKHGARYAGPEGRSE